MGYFTAYGGNKNYLKATKVFPTEPDYLIDTKLTLF